jgi:hypothetical protein|tara:strand:+ start:617 stop:967 length:351 start_codon:yes stop_codon:yes gene_type:complete
MATNPLNKFTVAESSNLQVYENYSSEQITCATSYVEGTNWISSGDGPAKEILIVPYSTNDATDVISLQLKIGGSYGDEIKLLYNDYPLTISGLITDQIKMKSDEGTDEIFTILSFH